MNKIYILIFLLLICIVQVQAIPAGTKYNVTNIDYCYGNYLIKMRGTVNSSNIIFNDCNYINNTLWECKCLNPSVVSFNTKNQTRGQFNLIIQYQIEKTTDDEIEILNAQKILNFNNIIIGKEAKEPFVWPEIDSSFGLVIVFIIIFIIIMIFSVFSIMKKLFFTDDEVEKKSYSDENTIEWLEDLNEKR